jgi:hypothetical protein
VRLRLLLCFILLVVATAPKALDGCTQEYLVMSRGQLAARRAEVLLAWMRGQVLLDRRAKALLCLLPLCLMLLLLLLLLPLVIVM